MAIPIVYRKSSESGIASYNYTDLASATGYVTYYGGSAMSGATMFYRLASNAFWSHRVQTSANVVTAAFTKDLDLDFDVLFKMPQTIKGDIIVNIPYGCYDDTAGHLYTLFPQILVKKWDGTTETIITTVSGSQASYTPAGIGEYLYRMECITLAIPATHFKKDETLRITTELYSSDALAGQRHVFIGHDPKNRATSPFDTPDAYTFGTEPSNLIIQVPFKLDL